MLKIKDKTFTILGGGRSGLALIELLQAKGAIARLSDSACRENVTPEYLNRLESYQIDFELGQNSIEFLAQSDCLLLSPGVSVFAKELQHASLKSIPVIGEIEFAAQFCDKPIIAITGSNGKTTVTTLIAQVLNASAKRAVYCGNIGVPFSSVVLNSDNIDYFVCETSSFQLESMLSPYSPFRIENTDNAFGFKGFKPWIGVLLNFSDNHLDRHADMDEYFAAKKRLFLNQDEDDFAVLNADQKQLSDIQESIDSQSIFFSAKDKSDVDANQAAVIKVAELCDVSRQTCLDVFNDFKGVEHRLELVRELNGVDFINDSKSTTAEATRWAINNIDKPIVLLCGGRDKNIDFSVLTDLIRDKVKTMIAYGECRQKFEQTFNGVIELKICETLESAVKEGRQSAAAGECVVLSPMCASFDAFKNFEERGLAFKKIVTDLE